MRPYHHAHAPTSIATYDLTMSTGDGAHKASGEASLDGQGGTEPVSIAAVSKPLIWNDRLDISDEQR